ncbi:MAG: hypothetical protein PWQ72_2084, partial [Pseudothermotoga sp.]|nr:hypothetical protein [Pseudothermotoga sp.]MDK2954488.1 hypothetical protein [Kosmotoga sp.]
MNSGGRFQVFYDKKNDRWLIYTNHFGEKQIFYLKLPDRVVFASELPWIMKYIKNNGVSYSIDEIGAYFLLTYSYMLEDYTIIKEIKKLPAGWVKSYILCKFVLVSGNGLMHFSYFLLKAIDFRA